MTEFRKLKRPFLTAFFNRKIIPSSILNKEKAIANPYKQRNYFQKG